MFIDTSAFYALNDPHDRCHSEAKSYLDAVRNALHVALFTSNYIIDESLTLIRMKLGHDIAVRFGTQVRESKVLTIIRIEEDIEEAAWDIFQSFTDKEYSFTDCTSFAVMKQQGISDAFAFDKHFRQHGFIVHPKAQPQLWKPGLLSSRPEHKRKQPSDLSVGDSVAQFLQKYDESANDSSRPSLWVINVESK